MSTAKRRKIHNSYRYFTIAADEYGERCMKGSIFHAGRAPGIRWEPTIQNHQLFRSDHPRRLQRHI